VLPPGGGDDGFALLGFPRRFHLDEAALKAAYFALSRRLHPDANPATSPETRERILRQSAVLNNAYVTLKDWPKRFRYLLALERPATTGDAAANDSRFGAQNLEYFELMEAIQGARMADGPDRAAGLAAMEARVWAEREAVERDLAELGRRWDTAQPSSPAATEALDGMQAKLETLKFLDRMLTMVYGEEPVVQRG
jgi:molecular chaperone HscB